MTFSKRSWLLVVLCVLGILAGCSRIKGDFGYRLPGMDSFKRFDNAMQFSDAQRAEWTFVTKGIKEPRYLGVIILKKEVVWVEVFKEVRQINGENPAVFGTIFGYEPGQYRVVLTENNELVDEREFVVYHEEEDILKTIMLDK